MRLSVDFSALHQVVEEMGATEVDFELDLLVTKPFVIDLKTGVGLGGDIKLEEISNEFGVLSGVGQQLMLYIPDQGDNVENVIKYGKKAKQGRRVHVAECRTLETVRNGGRFEKYVVINRVDGMFPVFGRQYRTGKEMKQEAELAVCKNCLQVLNYQGCNSFDNIDSVVQQFDFRTFFATYSSYFNTLPSQTLTEQSSNYTDDWPAISARIRADTDYSCQQCGVNLRSVRRLLHVHHINGVKTDNSQQNLRAICADCHKKQPLHGHLLVKDQDIIDINLLRREQSKFDVHNYHNLLACADTALAGLILKCQNSQLAIGELGLAIKCGDNAYATLDLAWPRAKVAVLMKKHNEARVLKAGWSVFSVNDALVNFAKFQRAVR